MKRVSVILVATAALLTGCQLFNRALDSASEIFGDEVVARVGEHKLHRSALSRYIPAGVSPEDSLSIARQYIDSWAEELIVLDMAEEQLSKSQKDVKAELEEYRRTLLKYRYEQMYVNERLDTLVSEEEILEYYGRNSERFVLERPILKARFIVTSPEAPGLKKILQKMSSDNMDDILEAESMASTAAIRYVDYSDTWLDAITLARELGTDYVTMMSSIKDRMVQFTDASGNLRAAYVVDLVQAGKTAPLEYCSERVRDIIVNTRKHALIATLERDLLEDARRSGKYTVH